MHPTRAGRYLLHEPLGQGGMATVYRATDTSLGREVAVKILHPHLTTRPEHRRRFAREARATARLDHPAIVRVFDASDENSATDADAAPAYLVAERIHGPTLRQRIDDTPLSPPELAAALGWVLADALAHAHAHGVLHRDIKPENIMLQCVPPGDLKLTDFGLAQLVDRDDKMTATGAIVGSPAHLAPELLDGQPATERTDLYALGTVLYWLVAGTLPFDGPSTAALFQRILDGHFEPLRRRTAGVSTELARAIESLIARDPAARPESAVEVRDRLGAALAASGVQDPQQWVRDWIAAPDEVSRRIRDDIATFLCQQADEVSRSRPARAAQLWGRVLDVAPGTPWAGRARVGLDRLGRRDWWKKAAATVLGVTLVAAAATWVGRRSPSPTVDPIRPEFESTPSRTADSTTVSTTIPATPTAVPTARPTAGTEPRPSPAIARPLTPKSTSAPMNPTPATSTSTSTSTPAPRRPAAPPPPVPVQIMTQPWMEVRIDGEARGRTPFDAPIPPGTHEIRLERSCCETLERRVTLRPGEPFQWRARPLPRPAQLRVVAEGLPPESPVLVDGEWRGTLAELRQRPLPVVIDAGQGPRTRYARVVELRIGTGDARRIHTLTLSAGQELTVD